MDTEKKIKGVKKDKGIPLLLILLVPVVGVALLNLATLIPYIGSFIQSTIPLLALFIFFFIGMIIGEKAKEVEKARRRLLLGYVLIVCTLTFVAPDIVGYYTYPIKVSRNVADKTHTNMTYTQAADAVKAMLKQEIGSDGVVAYAIYAERTQLSAQNYGQYVGDQFEDVDDLGGIISAVINIIIYTIPMLLKWLLCNKLGWVAEPGYVGLAFWYLVSMIISYIGWKSGSDDN